jgi:adenosylcobyric acid synthase
MLQGTGSDVGKSLLVAGLARAYARAGFAVRPFKPQNMSNNAAVTVEGGEIGRAQALQARACYVEPSVHMNPVLLKPQSERGAQLVVQGKMAGNANARDYQEIKRGLMGAVLDSFERLSKKADLVLVEGAGSAAEVNLRDGDIANMGFAEAADLPVLLVADIERGGAIAAMVGTWELLSASERARLKGYIINKFRGDPALFDGGIARIAAHTGLESFGVVPWFAAADRLPAEDSLALDRVPDDSARKAGHAEIRVAVPRLPHIANFDDLDPLAAEPGVVVEYVVPGRPMPADADLIVLPGSKATLADLAFLYEQGWDIDIKAHRRRGKPIIGLCAGYQMLGTRVADPDGIEGRQGSMPGLGLLDVATSLTRDKQLRSVEGRAGGVGVAGYEMHLGETRGPDCARPFVDLGGRADGARSEDGLVAGCYLHGLFASDPFRASLLADLGAERQSALAYEESVEETLDALADHLAESLDLDRILAIARSRC